MCLKTSVHKARYGLADWLEGFDTRALEFPNGLVNVVQSCMVLTTVSGKSVAPFLEGALFRLDAAARVPVWCVLLLFTGCFQLIALAIGTKRDTYLLRLLANILASFVSLAIVLALYNGVQPWIIGVRYFIPVGALTFAALATLARHDSAKATDENDAPNPLD